MGDKKRTHVVPKEDAVFWLDENGRWHNVHGVFQHKKIAAYFHSAIRKDSMGYHLYQEDGEGVAEKVYFRYEDTALFVFDIETTADDDIILVLNTRKKLPLDPSALFVKNDHLYTTHEGDAVKFTDRALIKLADRLELTDTRYSIRIKERDHDIPVRS